MKRKLISATALLVALVIPQQVILGAQQVIETNGTEIRLPVGKGSLIRLDRPAVSIFVADPDIADVHVRSPTLIYLVGKAPGGTSLFAIDAAERLVLSTDVAVGFDETRLQQIIYRHSPESRVVVSSVNDALVLTGEVPSAAEGEEILRIASRFIGAGEDNRGAWIINRLSIKAPNQVNLRVRVAEVSREAGRTFGFNWSSIATIGDAVIGIATGADILDDAGNIIRPSQESGAIFGAVDSEDVSVNVLLEAMERQGLITILAEPNLTARSGEPASFLAGGEYPIPVPQGPDQITIQYKRFGVSLAFVATILDSNRISLTVRPEVSQLSNAGAITLNGITVPALTTRRAETTVDLASGQSFAIAGLLQNTRTEDLDRFPGLGDLPVIGSLFRSRRFQENQSELVIIVTPYLVRPVTQRLPTPVDLVRTGLVQPGSSEFQSAAEPAAMENGVE